MKGLPGFNPDCDYCAAAPPHPCATHHWMHDRLVRDGVLPPDEDSDSPADAGSASPTA